LYNVLDHANSLEACFDQRETLRSRGLLDLYENYIKKLFEPTAEMSCRGLPLNRETQAKLIAEYEGKSKALIEQLSRPINPRSPKQKIALLQNQGIRLSVKRNKKTGKSAFSADELSLKKARLKHPGCRDIELL